MSGAGFKWMRIVLVALLAAAALASSPVISAQTSRRAPTRGGKLNTYHKSGTIIFSDWGFPPTLNTYQSGLSATVMTMNLVQEGLDLYNNHAQLQPDLLATLPTIKNHEILNGGKTIILKLKPHLYWSSGVEITNRDILFGWRMYMDPATGPACLGTCDHIRSITLKGNYEAILHLKDDYAPILGVGLPPAWPHSWAAAGSTPHAAATKLAQDTNFNFENPSYWTDGPYQVAQFVNNDRIVLTPMKYYHVHPGPFVKKFIFAFYASKDAMIGAAGADQTNITTDYTPADLGTLLTHKNVFKTWVTPSFVEEHLEYNCIDKTVNGKPNPLVNVRVRQALTLAINKIGMIRSALDATPSAAKSIVAYTPWTVTPHLTQMYGDKALKGSWDPIAKQYLPYSARTVRDAKTLLKEAGYGNGFSIDVLTTAGNPVRQNEVAVIQNNWEQLGVHATLTTVPPSLILADWGQNGPLIHGNFMVSLWAFGQSPDPDGLHNYFESRFIDRTKTNHSAVNANFAGIRNHLIDEGMTKGAASFNPKVRAKWYRIVQEQMSQGAYWVPLFYRANIVTSDHHVTGDTQYPAPSYFGNTWNTWSWKYASS